MYLFRIYLVICFAFSVFFISCEAPRNNPLDPVSDMTPFLEKKLLIYSQITNKYFNTRYEIFVQAKIKDENKVIDSVFIESIYFQFKKYLSFNSATQSYEAKITIAELKTDKFEDVVGQEFRLKVRDYSSRILDLGSASVTRVTLDDIRIISPINSDIVNNPLKMNWEKYEGKFSFHYEIEVKVDEDPNELVWKNNIDINQDSSSTTLDINLPVGDYIWIIWVVDDFENRFSSKPASFKIR